MNAPLYAVNDLVRIKKEPWNVHSDDVVVITDVENIDGIWVYKWVIPEEHGSVPQQLIAYCIYHNKKI
jgi:hypothetical protein